ncbi:hypothetical protein [Methanosarcina sp. UBA5]|nr:hypothetical protein [Methanosarcina sp. UBA5]
MLNGKTIVDENRIFDCLKIIATIYEKLVMEHIERDILKEK